MREPQGASLRQGLLCSGVSPNMCQDDIPVIFLRVWFCGRVGLQPN